VERKTQNLDRSAIIDRPSSSEKKDLREAGEKIRNARGDDEAQTPVDAKRTGNRPRFDRDR